MPAGGYWWRELEMAWSQEEDDDNETRAHNGVEVVRYFGMSYEH